jgi:hypothetical protein
LSSSSANFTHVFTIAAYDLTAFAACFAGFITAPFVSYTLAMRGAATLRSNLLLLLWVHSGKSTIRTTGFLGFPVTSFLAIRNISC